MLREVPALERRLRAPLREEPLPAAAHGDAHHRPGAASRRGVPQSNVIPALGEMTLDVRVTPGVGADELHAELEPLCRAREAAVEGVKVEWEPVNAFRLATKVDKAEPLVQAMVKGVRQATGMARAWGRAGLHRRHHPAHGAGIAHRDVRARESADSAPGGRVRRR
jgi:acetylornithine deacetylase/succinyl-diaminopimelate desuccinylase-like protein